MLMMTLEHHGLNGRNASHWLRGSLPQWRERLSLAERVLPMGSRKFIPTHSPQLANDTCLEPYGSTNCIPSILEGMWGVVDRKAGSPADA